MKKYIQMGLLSLFLVSFFSACEHMGSINNQTLSDRTVQTDSLSISTSEEDKVQAALQKDALLARKMPLKQYARHMKKRHAYYRQFRTTFEDDFVMIVVEGDKMILETPKGKVKFEYNEEGQ
jgi:Zn/Cd-binding protein ZinT